MKINLRQSLRSLLLTFLFLFLSGCGATAPAATSSVFSVDLVSPRTPSVIWPQSAYILAAQANGPAAAGSQAVHITFSANGQTIGAVDSTVGSQATLKWTPSAVGEYTIQAEAQANGNLASSKLIQMCILNIDTSQGFRIWGYGYKGTCAVPPASTSTAPIVFTPTAKPASLSYNFNCSSSVAPTVINFEVKVNDPGNRVAFVNIKYSGQNFNFKNPTVIDGASETSFFDSLMLTQTSTQADGTKIFTGSTEDLGPISAALLAGSTAQIEWSARALKSGDVGAHQLLVEDGPHIIPIAPCTAPSAP